MEEDFNFDNPKPLSASFEDNDRSYEAMVEMDCNALWHELGHLFGLILAEANNNKLAKAERIIINNIENKMCTKDDEFKTLNETIPCIDFYGEKNKCLDKDDELRLTSKLNDINKSLYYFSYLLLGGIFHIFIRIDNPTNEHFEDCYTDDELNVDSNGIYGRAGSDWSKLRRLASLKKWELVHLKNLSFDIYNFLKNYKIFEHLKPKIEELYKEFKNKQIIEGDDMIKSEEKLKEIFKDIPKCTSQFYNEIIKKYIPNFN